MRTILAVVAVFSCLLSGCNSKSAEPIRAAGVNANENAVTSLQGGESFENPVYKRWANFPTGTTVTQRTTTANADSPLKTVTEIIYTLKEKKDDSIVVEFVATTTHTDGRSEKNPPQENNVRKTFVLPPGVKKPPDRKSDEGEESLTVAGRVFKTRWYKGKDFTEAGELSSQTWSSDEMPGGLVKSVSQVPARRATITVEVIEVTIPK
jgi:hypothetical protein